MCVGFKSFSLVFQAVEVGQGGWLEPLPRGSLSSSDKRFGTGEGGWEKFTKE